ISDSDHSVKRNSVALYRPIFVDEQKVHGEPAAGTGDVLRAIVVAGRREEHVSMLQRTDVDDEKVLGLGLGVLLPPRPQPEDDFALAHQVEIELVGVEGLVGALWMVWDRRRLLPRSGFNYKL